MEISALYPKSIPGLSTFKDEPESFRIHPLTLQRGKHGFFGYAKPYQAVGQALQKPALEHISPPQLLFVGRFRCVQVSSVNSVVAQWFGQQNCTRDGNCLRKNKIIEKRKSFRDRKREIKYGFPHGHSAGTAEDP